VSLEYEVLRLRRLKWSLIRARELEALEGFLVEHLDYDVYAEQFAEDLAEILQDFRPEDQADSAQTLANKYARNGKIADEKRMRSPPSAARPLGKNSDQTEHAHARSRMVKFVLPRGRLLYPEQALDAIKKTGKTVTAAMHKGKFICVGASIRLGSREQIGREVP